MLDQEEFKKEEQHLNYVQDQILPKMQKLENSISASQEEYSIISQTINDAFYDREMQEQDIATLLNDLERTNNEIAFQKNNLFVLKNQNKSPYFGRIDFYDDEYKDESSFYIGVAHLFDNTTGTPLVLDWRAPICSMYYDYEIGKASYVAPMGKVQGKITKKRQYKTSFRELIYAFDSNLTINDEILQRALGGNADDRMKSIVSTIQKDQNKIIRNSNNVNMIIQGVAGSGKTSIALHRVAYLLYKNKILSSEILLISPSVLFSDYISDVLPELGESNTPKITFMDIVKEELEGFVHFEERIEMMESILQGDVQREKEVGFKASFEFYEKLKKYLATDFDSIFKARDIPLGKDVIPAEEINKLYCEKYSSKVPALRIEWIADYILEKLNIPQKLKNDVFLRIKKVLYGMFENSDILAIYSEFLKSLGMELDLKTEIKKRQEHKVLKYEDIPAVLYIKNHLLGVQVQKQYKYVVVDEMQDYSPITIDLFEKIFPCKKVYLGDIYQCFEKKLEKDYIYKLAQIIDGASVTELNTTYRSTVEIATHNQKLIGLKDVNNFTRHGEPVRKKDKPASIDEAIEVIADEIRTLSEKFDKIAVITDTLAFSESIYEKLFALFGKSTAKNLGLELVDSATGDVGGKINVISSVFSKGLEFDAVIFVNNYYDTDKRKVTISEKNVAYIACTRALHELVVV